MNQQVRRKVMAANWKMYKTRKEAAAFMREFVPLLRPGTAEIVICPPATLLTQLAEQAAGSALKIGVQNIHWPEQGAYTGEISADMAAEAGARYCLCGHSERRHYFGESSEMVARKTQAAVRHGLTPIVCVGETLEQRENGETLQVLHEELLASLSGVDAEPHLVVAYEPVWAIGTGQVATPADAEQAVAHLRGVLRGLWGATAERLRILYGGSVKADNIEALLHCPNVDGVLVGGASLEAKAFAAIVNAGQEG